MQLLRRGVLRQLHDELDAAVIEAYGWNQEQGNHRFTPMNTDNSFEHQALIGVHRRLSVVKKVFPWFLPRPRATEDKVSGPEQGPFQSLVPSEAPKTVETTDELR